MSKSLFGFLLLCGGGLVSCSSVEEKPPQTTTTTQSPPKTGGGQQTLPPESVADSFVSFRELTNDQIQKLPLKTIKQLSEQELKELTSEDTSFFTKEQIQAFNKKQIQSLDSLNDLKLQVLTPQQLLFLTKKQIQNLFQEVVRHFIRSRNHSFSPEQISFFTKVQITYLEHPELQQILSHLNPEQMRFLTKYQIPYLTKKELLPLIHLLSPEQMRFLTKHQISSLTKEELLPLIHLLSPEQMVHFPKKYISAIPVKNLTPPFLKQYSKHLTEKQIQNLNKEQIQMLPIPELNKNNIRGLILRLEDLTSDQIKSFTFAQFDVLDKFHIDMLLKDTWPERISYSLWTNFKNSYVESLTKGIIQHQDSLEVKTYNHLRGDNSKYDIPAEALAGFVGYFSSKQFSHIPARKFKKFNFKDLENIPVELLPHLTFSQIRSVSAKNIKFLNAQGKAEILNLDQVKTFTPKQIPHLSLLHFTRKQVQALTKEQIPHLTAIQIQTLWEANFTEKPEVPADQIFRLPMAEIKKLEAEYNKPEKIYLSPEQMAYLTEDQMRMFLPEQIPNFTRADIEAISPVKFSFFSPKEYMDGDLNTPDLFKQIQAFTPEQMALLSKEQIQAMRLQQSSVLTADQIRLMDPLQVMAFSEKQILVMPPQTQQLITTYRQSYEQNLPH